MRSDNVILKTDFEIKKIYQGGQLLAQIIATIKKQIYCQQNFQEIDQIAAKLINQAGGQASFLNYNGYPAHICLSRNNEIVHGTPTKDKRVKSDDLIHLDIGFWYQGFHTDSAITFTINQPDKIQARLIKAAQTALNRAITQCRPGNELSLISNAIEKTAYQYHLVPVNGLTGHGIGRNIHEPPSVPNYAKQAAKIKLRPGMVLAIEPMFCNGKPDISIDSDGWTVKTKDGSMSVHFEHTIAITNASPLVITKHQ